MEIHRSGIAQPEFLDSESKTTLQEVNDNYLISPFSKLDFLLSFVEEKKSESLEAFVKGLSADLDALLEGKYISHKGLDVDAVLAQNATLARFPELAEKTLNYFLVVLGLTDQEMAVDESMPVVTGDLYRSYLYPVYAYLQTLFTVLGREEAASLYKQYITLFHLTNQADSKDFYEDVASIYANAVKNAKPDSVFVMVRGLIAEGKYAFKNKNCPLVEALQDLPDKEILYLICCYGDYARFARFNDHFILTMEHTIVQGDGYCSRIIHDTRLDYDLRHPLKEFWDNFESEKEETAHKILNEWREQNQDM